MKELFVHIKNFAISAIFVLLIAFIFEGCGGCFQSDNSSSYDEPKSYYKTGNPEDMTNKEYQNYMEWRAKEQQKEWENSPAFK